MCEKMYVTEVCVRSEVRKGCVETRRVSVVGRGVRR